MKRIHLRREQPHHTRRPHRRVRSRGVQPHFSIAAVLPEVLPQIAFGIVKPLALTGAFIGTAALVHATATTSYGPDEDADVTDDEVPVPLPVPLPVPFPAPDEATNKPRPGECTINGAS